LNAISGQLLNYSITQLHHYIVTEYSLRRIKMKFALLIYEDEQYYEEATPADWEAATVAHNAFAAEAAERSMDPSGDALQPVATGRTVRFSNSGQDVLVTDGPYAETKEQLGGFYLLDCESMDEAIEMARKLPVQVGAVEVRPVMVFE
jgi:hypothetical protein